MGQAAQATTDHDTIRQWVESRGGEPACVKGTEQQGPGCLLRIRYPDYSEDEDLQTIDWDAFFRTFDENELAFLYQDQADGSESRFSKLVDRRSVEA